MTDIYAFGPGWDLPATVQDNVRQVVQDWLTSHPSGDALVNQKLTALETGKADKTHTHTTAQVDGLAAALAAAGKVQSVLGKTGAITAQDFIDAGLNGSSGSLELQAAKDYTNTAVSTRVPFRLSGGQDLNTLTVTEDVLFTGVAGMMNAPDTSVGALQIRNASGNISQVWRPLVRTTPVAWARVKVGDSAWSEWNLTTPQGLAQPSSVSFNDMTVPGIYPIQNTSHAGMPVATVGTLEVLPATGLLLQRFTTWGYTQTVYMRSQLNSTSWSSWAKAPTPADISTINSGISGLDGRVTTLEEAAPTGDGGTGAEDFAAPTRTAVTAQPVEVESKAASAIIMSLSKDRSRGWNANTASVSETRDDGATWAQLTNSDGSNPFAGSTVESVRQLDNGELLVSNYSAADDRRYLWLSEGYNTGTMTFTKTLTARAPLIKFTSAWSQADHGRIVLVNEYGPKTGSQWSGRDVAPGENARHTYLSTDYGKTWTNVFDLNAYLTDVQGRATTDGQHLHGVAWDPYWDRIWVTFGDNMGGNGSNGILYSDDLGETWETAHYFADGADAPHQLVGIQPMPKCVLFYGDMGPDVVRIDRSEGRYKAGGYATPVAFDSTAAGKHLCQGFMRADRRGDDAPAIAAFSSEGTTAPSFAVATLDGYTFAEIWRDPADQAPGMGSRSIVGPTLRGKVIISSNDQKVSGQWSQITTDAPGY